MDCDICGSAILEKQVYFHCYVCKPHCGKCGQGNFDLCQLCVDQGHKCHEDLHDLIKMTVEPRSSGLDVHTGRSPDLVRLTGEKRRRSLQQPNASKRRLRPTRNSDLPPRLPRFASVQISTSSPLEPSKTERDRESHDSLYGATPHPTVPSRVQRGGPHEIVTTTTTSTAGEPPERQTSLTAVILQAVAEHERQRLTALLSLLVLR